MLNVEFVNLIAKHSMQSRQLKINFPVTLCCSIKNSTSNGKYDFYRVLANAPRRVPDASKSAGTHRLSKWCVPWTRPNYPQYAAVNYVISDTG